MDIIAPDPGLCDVCHKNPMIGVASTSVPFSCAYCSECAEQGADPEWIFVMWAEDHGYKPQDLVSGLVTYKDGRYLTYEKWYNERDKK